MTLSIESFLDEMKKISAASRLTSSEKRKQMLQFAGLGAVAVPSMTSAISKIQSGRWIPSAAKSPRRWLAGAVGQGLFWGGALPTLQHGIARANIRKAKDRVAAEKTLRQLTPGGVQRTLSQLPAKELALPGAGNV